MKQIQKLLPVIMVLSVSLSYGQVTFKKLYDLPTPNIFSCMTITSDSGYIGAGMYTNIPNLTFGTLLVKTNSLGDTLWTRIISGESQETPYDIVQLDDGGFLIAGSRDSMAGPWNIYAVVYFMKTDAMGNLLWKKSFVKGPGATVGANIFTANDGGFFLSTSFGSEEIFLMRADINGNITWLRRYANIGGNSENVCMTADSGFIIAGGIGYYRRVIRTDATGDTIWTKTFEIWYGNDAIGSVIEATDGSIVLTGGDPYQPSIFDPLILKLDSTGSVLWCRRYGSTYLEYFTSMIETNDGGFLLVGGGGSLKTDSAGNFDWAWEYGGVPDLQPHKILQAIDGGFLIGAFTNTMSFPPPDKACLIKTDANGNSGCADSSLFHIIFNCPLFPKDTINIVDVPQITLTGLNSTLSYADSVNITTLCFSTGQESPATSEKINVYPNPSTGKFTIENFGVKNCRALEIFDVAGKTVYSRKWIENNTEVVIKDPGIYLLKCYFDDNRYYYSRIVVTNDSLN